MKKVLALIMVMALFFLLCVTSVSSAEYITWNGKEIELVGENRYADITLDLIYPKVPQVDTIFYGEIYEYYSEENTAAGDEATPDYVLINTALNSLEPMPIADVFGDYVLWDYCIRNPFSYCYCIYLPESGEVYDLVDAWKMNMDGIENVFTEGGIGELIGDMDKDRKLTVKDATYIQKCIAGIEKFGYNDKFEYFASMLNSNWDEPKLLYISDFNRDGERNVKDATAIQKYIAGLPY